MAILGVLIVQYVLGMYLNLYVSFPVGQASSSVVYIGEAYLVAHLILGYVIGIISMVILVFSILTRRKSLTVSESLGFISVLIAGLSGIEFAFTSHYTNDSFSYVMAIAFLAAISVYSYMASLLRKKDLPSKAQTI